MKSLPAPPTPGSAVDPALRHGVAAGGLHWRLRCEGQGPDLLLLHGTASSLASWDGCCRQLRQHFRVWVPDLPGHGQTRLWPDGQASLPRMAQALAALLQATGCRPALVAGHSAGAALMLQLWLDGAMAPRGLLAVNGAVLPLQGLAGWLFPPLARLLAASPGLPGFVARRAAQPAALQRLIRSTGSQLDGQGLAHYQQLLSSGEHVAGALAMMAGWQLDGLLANLHRVTCPVWLAAAERDATVPPSQAWELARRLPQASVHPLAGWGHLVHEEAPAVVSDCLRALWASVMPRP